MGKEENSGTSEGQSRIKGLKLRRIDEGAVSIFVPDPNYYRDRRDEYLPATLPVFYNPKMELNRDISVLILKAYIENFERGDTRYMEGLAASGIRGFRISKELQTSVEIILNDINPRATALMEYNRALLNTQEKIEIFNLDFNFLCHKLKKESQLPNVIEIDPFGTPTPFLHAAINALDYENAMLICSATDLTVLHGKYPKVALRKYGSKIINTPFSKELSIRALLYTIGRIAGNFNRYIKPLVGFFFDNFAKVAVLINKGKRKANAMWEKIGWLHFCPVCHSFWFHSGITPRNVTECNHQQTQVAGPLWLDSIVDENFGTSMLSTLDDLPIRNQNSWKLRKAIRRSLKGKDIPFFYDVNRIAQRLSLPLPKVNEVVEGIRTKGHNAYRTHFCSTGVKTNIPARLVTQEVKKCIKRGG
ncbi:MAG: hypothetical protein GWO20_10855 [Candidatus Korarchaeota archaeon]|nr:hypothetical protein [Candidatus Korarchaeota archaeon]NIU83973.1 hypothetical protein [Candidatus Thorarchaeota archaeon]NIW14097.1 hypothetical protein [Candidatus Thorarchaeota archaeon]NIW52207.1 hypothetical protein [Candidatus Korarchaeota archaeon]